jgi:hypothetical protein
MATTARARRQSAPKADTKAEVPAKPRYTFVHQGNIHHGFKARVVRAAVTVKQGAKRAVAAVVKTVRTAAAKVAVTARAVATVAIEKTQSVVASRPRALRAYLAARLFAARLWHRSIRPLLRAMMYAFAIVAVFVALAVGFTVAPLATILIYAGLVAAMLAIARGLRALEAAEVDGSTWARRTLNALNIGARVLRVLAYAAAAALTAALCAVSLSFAAFVAIDVVLSYLEVRGATTIAFLVSCAISGQWEIAIAWVLWRAVRGGVISDASPAAYDRAAALRRDEMDAEAEVFEAETARAHRDVVDVVDAVVELRPCDAPNNPELWTRGNHLIAKGTEEMWGTEHDAPPVTADEIGETHDMRCAACTEASSGLLPSRVNGDLVCEVCYAAEAEDAALRYTGVSLKARSVEVRLNQAGVEASDEYALSRAVAAGQLTAAQRATLAESGWVEGDDAGVWLLVAEWRDKQGREFPREWVCLYDGIEVARVSHERKRNVYTASVMGEVASRTWNDRGAARRAANRQLRDYESSVAKKVAELGSIAGPLAAQGA